MKFRVTFKDPDVLHEAIEEAVEDTIDAAGLDEDEAEAIRDLRIKKVRDQVGKWFEYGEYLEVEIDTEKDTCTVVQR